MFLIDLFVPILLDCLLVFNTLIFEMYESSCFCCGIFVKSIGRSSSVFCKRLISVRVIQLHRINMISFFILDLC